VLTAAGVADPTDVDVCGINVPATVTRTIPFIYALPVVPVEAVAIVELVAVLTECSALTSVASVVAVLLEASAVHVWDIVAVPPNPNPNDPDVVLIPVNENEHSKKYVPTGSVIDPFVGPPPPSNKACAAVELSRLLADVRTMKCSTGAKPRLLAVGVP
jgi:hypothetical protein